MTVDQIVSLLAQLPLVGVFIWYSDRMYKNFQDFLREERQARKEQNDSVVIELRALRAELNEHDRNVLDRAVKAATDAVRKSRSNE